MNSEKPAKHACPFCRRPLNLKDRSSGKLCCSGCHNFFYYDADTGKLSPQFSNAAKINRASNFPAKLKQRRVILAVLLFSLFALGILGWLAMPERNINTSLSDKPEAVLDEVSSHLKSLAE